MKYTPLAIFETHPIQYRVPVYQRLNQLRPNSFKVIFASDFSVRGYVDPGFNTSFSWDTPLLEGYDYAILNPNSQSAPQLWQDLSAPGIPQLLQKWKPHAILLTSFGYRFNTIVYLTALCLGIPIWLRLETQDEAFERSFYKSLIRSSLYRVLYLPIQKAFTIGNLNHQHYLSHGVSFQKLQPVRYCTPNPLQNLTRLEKLERRNLLRQSLSIDEENLVVAFFGKFLPKKDPELLFNAIQYISPLLKKRIRLLFVGSGDLQDLLQSQASSLQADEGICSHFPGFVNQTQLPNWYLASDLVILPSRQMGETWGLVVNEALQAGCGVVVSTAVGCHADFGTWERVRTIPVGDAQALALAINELACFKRDFDWAELLLDDYSIESAAQSLAQAIDTLSVNH